MTSATLAAGAAIWRPPADPAEDAEVLLVHRPTYDDWSLPKGKSDAGEHILLTAVREVWEETCVRPVLGPRLPTVEYISWGRPKQVSYWSSFSEGHQAAPGNEIDAVSWLPLGQAREQLAGTHDDPVISAFRPFCACTGRTSPMCSPKPARCSARPPPFPRIRRCPRAASGWRTPPWAGSGEPAEPSWPAWSATSPDGERAAQVRAGPVRAHA